MKVTINIDCTPEEARSFLGAPDLAKMQKAFFEAMQQKIDEGVASVNSFDSGAQDAEQAFKSFTEYNIQTAQAFHDLIMKSMSANMPSGSDDNNRDDAGSK